jgi:hypothetical protein
LALIVHADVLIAGTHVWHALAGLAAVAEYVDPLMEQPAPQAPVLLHTWPVAQPVPLGRFVQAVVLVAGWHVWHAPLGSLGSAAFGP